MSQVFLSSHHPESTTLSASSAVASKIIGIFMALNSAGLTETTIVDEGIDDSASSSLTSSTDLGHGSEVDDRVGSGGADQCAVTNPASVLPDEEVSWMLSNDSGFDQPPEGQTKKSLARQILHYMAKSRRRHRQSSRPTA
ncbi:hypothetical protein BOX15_Mlig032055g2 [Macrostomum lignano]|uniref:Uncharacterized protein n=1 Tax=Macrostomum lignano TaxID=282301 RepID=A0A267EBR8_9PLAT|nr:hypothetical protein BOX15_Mlig032055g2 [Macrostomum lignano]